jgi:hypothetical protein
MEILPEYLELLEAEALERIGLRMVFELGDGGIEESAELTILIDRQELVGTLACAELVKLLEARITLFPHVVFIAGIGDLLGYDLGSVGEHARAELFADCGDAGLVDHTLMLLIGCDETWVIVFVLCHGFEPERDTCVKLLEILLRGGGVTGRGGGTRN